MGLNAQQWVAVVLMIAVVMRIAWLDLKTLRIPDHWNLAIAGLGLLYQLPFGVDHTLPSLAAALAIALFLILLRQGYFNATGRIGLGLGDVKFSGSAAIWFSPWNLPLFFLLASGSALIFSLVSLRAQPSTFRTTRIPFGPFLGLALILTWNIEFSSPFSIIP